VHIRLEAKADRSALRALNEAAFGTSAEADLLDALRSKSIDCISLVAHSGAALIGHILFSPVALAEYPEVRLMGLGPMAVAPQQQRQGIGTALVREGLIRCKRLGVRAVVVVGHPEYYPRFGFVPASRYSIRSEYDVPDAAFMAIELEAGALDGLAGLIRYDEAFSV
jgi:putative acetyltransferase